MYILFEHASGYAIFKVIAKEEIGALLPEVQESVQDLERFGKVVKLVAFSPFKSAVNALENLNSISEGRYCFINTCYKGISIVVKYNSGSNQV